MSIPVTVSIDDVAHIGHTAFPTGAASGNTVFVCSHATSGVELILLRSILDKLGYQVAQSHEYDIDAAADVAYETTMPWDMYHKIFEDNLVLPPVSEPAFEPEPASKHTLH